MENKNKKLNFWASLGLFILILNLTLLIAVPAYAQSVSGIVEEIGGTSSLPSYDTGHSEASYEEGASNITSAVLFAVDALKYLMGTIAVVIIISSGIRLITASKSIDEIATKQKENLKYAIIGLIVIIIADVLVKEVFFGEAGEVYRSEVDAQLAAERGAEQLRGIYVFIEMFVGALAVLMIVFAGFKLVISGGNEEAQGKAKKMIMYSVIGLIVIGVSEFVVKDVVFPDTGERISDVDSGKRLIVSFTNFVSGFVATVAVAFLMYGGFLYVTAVGREEQAGKAKKVLIGAIIGMLVAMAAFAIVNTLIRLEPIAETVIEDAGGLPRQTGVPGP
ncbi:pilin [Pseudomonadota bacterium]